MVFSLMMVKPFPVAHAIQQPLDLPVRGSDRDGYFQGIELHALQSDQLLVVYGVGNVYLYQQQGLPLGIGKDDIRPAN
ncbi:hypothetical protein [Hymenobacter guriensis]|uniref:Uncharacterized protein n=1 Tax=Hymenobacter guriensis TaxID=2793065 RepID=A0ABS0L4J9_9BACT|nr:hypothetical protein [Hymenobacter guriensis]MBG8555004.1 hypothetical protein [Hymenobacter guriensis]